MIGKHIGWRPRDVRSQEVQKLPSEIRREDCGTLSGRGKNNGLMHFKKGGEELIVLLEHCVLSERETPKVLQEGDRGEIKGKG